MWTFLMLAACSGGGDSTADSADKTGTTPTGPTTLSLSFKMEDDLIPSMSEPAIGTFRGSIYDDADANSIGPVDGAVSLHDFVVENVDLSDGGGPTGVLYTTEIAAARVWILGCLDSDLNECDQADPITLPNDNHPPLTAGVDNPVEVYLGLLNPS